MIYLDNNATTKPNSNMLNAVKDEVCQIYGNPSSLHRAGQDAQETLRDCREKVASSIGARPSEIIFTSGGTEANSLVMNNYEEWLKIISSVEHSSVANCKPDFTIPVNEQCLLDTDRLMALARSFVNPTIVSVMLVNNETGTILDPSNEIFKLKERYGFLLHVDAVQAFGKIEIDVENTPIDFLSISAHKCHGLKGAGALYVSRKIVESELPDPLFIGGSHERGFRPGTENQIGVLSLAYMANKISTDEHYQKRVNQIEVLRDRLEELLADIAEVNGSKEYRVGNTSNLHFLSLGATHEDQLDAFLEDLSENGICVSGKSACASGMPAPSRVLCRMFGDDSPRVHNSIRVSLSVDTTKENIEEAADKIRQSHDRCKELFGGKNG